MPTSPCIEHDIVQLKDIPLTMPDGIKLLNDIYHPKKHGRYPVLLIRVPYNKTSAQSYTLAHPIWYARHGYVVIVQDTRGRYGSEGDFYPLLKDADDAYETMNWAAKLPYSNGKIGTYGYSYAGFNQLLTAIKQHPNHVTCVPAFTGSDTYEDWNFSGGVFSLGFNAWWTLFLSIDTANRLGDSKLAKRLAAASTEFPQRYWNLPIEEIFPSEDLKIIAPYYYDWLEHPTRDDYWKRISIQEHYKSIRIPVLTLGGWFDTFIEGSLRNFRNLSFQNNELHVTNFNKLIIGPWYHMPWSPVVGGEDFGENAKNFLDDVILDWFNYWLKDEKSDFLEKPPVHIFTMGENKWHYYEEWPPSQSTEEVFYLHSEGRANSISGNGWLDKNNPDYELPDIFVYDPNDPVPSCGGRSCCVPNFSPMGARDQREVETRNDVLVFSTKLLENDLEVTGNVTLVLWASSTADDTTFTAKLVDVHPCGKAMNVCDGIIRASLRNSFQNKEPIIPGNIYRYEINLGATSHLFRTSHKIHLEVSSSNFPLYDRHPNTFFPSIRIDSKDLRLATQTIFHDSKFASFLKLPIITK